MEGRAREGQHNWEGRVRKHGGETYWDRDNASVKLGKTAVEDLDDRASEYDTYGYMHIKGRVST